MHITFLTCMTAAPSMAQHYSSSVMRRLPRRKDVAGFSPAW